MINYLLAANLGSCMAPNAAAVFLSANSPAENRSDVAVIGVGPTGSFRPCT